MRTKMIRSKITSILRTRKILFKIHKSSTSKITINSATRRTLPRNRMSYFAGLINLRGHQRELRSKEVIKSSLTNLDKP